MVETPEGGDRPEIALRPPGQIASVFDGIAPVFLARGYSSLRSGLRGRGA